MSALFRRILASVITVAAAAAVTVLAAAAPSRADTPVLPYPNAYGITLDSLTEVGGDWRMLDAVVSTAAVFQPIHVRIYLPSDYQTATGRRYPSLYLLHGAADPLDDALPWADPSEGSVASIVDSSPLSGIVVMPEGGKSGWYTDWKNPDWGGHQPLWETFHIDELLPWVDANFRTLADRSDRTIAGLSMGGFGALSYAGRHPDLFSAVGAFSPPSDIVHDVYVQQVIAANSVTKLYGSAITSSQEGQWNFLAKDVQDVFGPYGTWGPLNPYDLTGVYAANTIPVALYAGDGSTDAVEGLVRTQSDKFNTELSASGITHRYCAGTGTHSWPYWRGDLTDFLAYRYGTTPATCPNGWGQPQ